MARLLGAAERSHPRAHNLRGTATGLLSTSLIFFSATSLLLSIVNSSAAYGAARRGMQVSQEVRLHTTPAGSTASESPATRIGAGETIDATKGLLPYPLALVPRAVASTIVTTTSAADVPSSKSKSPTSSPTWSHRGKTPLKSRLKQGVYMGPLDPTGVMAFANRTGTKVSIASDFLPTTDGWSGVDGDNGSIQWLATAWKSSGLTLSLGVPIIPTTSSGQPEGTLAAGASGSYNSYFTKLATKLVAFGESNAYLRLGWEFDGSWYPWHAQGVSAGAEFASYFRQIVTSMRSVPGASFRFVWNPDASAFGPQGHSVTAAYPGNAYVDVIGLELYDWNWGPPETPQAAWKYTFLPELSTAEHFARSMGKPLSLSEWGVVTANSHGFGDDPYFIKEMIQWIKSPTHNVVFESYFNGNTIAAGGSPTLDLLGGNFPKSLSVFATSLH